MNDTEQTKKQSTPRAKMFTEEQVNKMLEEQRKAILEMTKKQTEAAIAEVLASNKETQEKIPKQDDKVTLVFLGTMADDCIFVVGKNLCTFTSLSRQAEIPKNEFRLGYRYLSKMLQKRTIIVTNGLSESEMKSHGLFYKDGENLSLEAYRSLLDYDKSTVCNIFAKACVEHKRIIARVFLSAYEQGDNRINFETVKALNDISKSVDVNGMFKRVVDGLAEKMTQ